MNSVVEEMLATGVVCTASGEALPLHSHLPRDECEVLAAWVRARRPRAVVEVGMGYGVSSLVIADALAGLPAGSYTVIDPHQRAEWRGAGVAALERAGFGGRFTLIERPSEIALPELLAAGTELDLAFVDGWHSFDQVIVDFYFINRMLRPGGAVVFDDLQLPSVAKAVAHIATYDCYRELAPPEECRRSVAARARRLMGSREFRIAGFEKVADDRRPWDWHREF